MQEKRISILSPSDFRKDSMTSMPLARVYSPVWEQMTLYLPLLGDSAMASVNPCRRSAATEEPTVPSRIATWN